MEYKIGDKFTLHGQYKRRTFWQWLRNEPRVLQEYVVTHVATSYSKYEAA